jgi:hypothetical protein
MGKKRHMVSTNFYSTHKSHIPSFIRVERYSMSILQRCSSLFLVVILFAVSSYGQDQPSQRRPGGGPPPPPREFPKPDSALIQQMFDKMTQAIEGKADSPAAKVFQNIQVWKTMPAGRMLGMMRNWTRILGVDCAHCHVIDQWDKDDKAPKLTARAMDKLEDDVNSLIKNIKSISNERAHVACWTCHRGQPQPEVFPFRPNSREPQRRGN